MAKLDQYEAHRMRAELERYYLSDGGLSSNLGPMIAVALGGYVANADSDRHVLRRHGVHGCSTQVTYDRRVRRALLSIGEPHASVLYMALGPRSWIKAIDDIFGRGVGERVVKRIGDMPGVALMTATVCDGYARDRERHASDLAAVATVEVTGDRVDAYRPAAQAVTASRWDSALGWIVALCARGDTAGAADRTAERSRIKREAERLLSDALAVYATARKADDDDND